MSEISENSPPKASRNAFFALLRKFTSPYGKLGKLSQDLKLFFRKLTLAIYVEIVSEEQTAQEPRTKSHYPRELTGVFAPPRISQSLFPARVLSRSGESVRNE